jgi:hypothetical protein
VSEELAYRERMLAYARVESLPLFPGNPRDKTPLVSQHLATTDPAILTGWWERWPNALIAHRIQPGKLLLDIDPRHGGDRTWDALEECFGPIQAGREHYSGRGDGGFHDWFLWPEELTRLTIKRLDEWAREHEVGSPVLDKTTGKPVLLSDGRPRWTCGIDLLHHDWRFTILPPSLHPDTQKPYRWRERNGELTPPPLWLTELLTPEAGQPDDREAEEEEVEAGERERIRVHDLEHGDSIADWFSAEWTWPKVLEPHGWRLVGGDGDADGSLWRHPDATTDHSASIRHGCLFVYTPNTPFEQSEESGPHGYTRFAAWAVLEHGGDQSAAAAAARALKTGSAPGVSRDALRNLPDDFWTARPVLADLRAWAHSRCVSADGVYAAVRARLGTLVPYTLRVDTGIASPLSLNSLLALVADSGGGKTTSHAEGRDLVPFIREDVYEGPLGSGEGVAELFFKWEWEPDPETGKRVKVRRQSIKAALLRLDEGEALTRMMERAGATIMPTLRSAYSGELIGATNAKEENRRILAAHSYRLVVMVGLQGSVAAMLLADALTGTPQRFVFFHANDPSIPDLAPAVARPWTKLWVPPTITDTEQTMTLPESVRAGIKERYLAAKRRGDRNALDSHRDQNRVVEAAMLALLEGRPEANEEDWHLAGMVMDTSDALRSWIMERGRASSRAVEDERNQAGVRRQRVMAEDAHSRAVVGGARAMARLAHRVAPVVVSKRKLTQATAGAHRQEASPEEMVAHAEAMDWLRPVEGGWIAGRSAPT